jgi:hypothetical protein
MEEEKEMREGDCRDYNGRSMKGNKLIRLSYLRGRNKCLSFNKISSLVGLLVYMEMT